jgi:hypothetical protein
VVSKEAKNLIESFIWLDKRLEKSPEKLGLLCSLFHFWFAILGQGQ